MSASEATATRAAPVPCHCIIAHPDKPKFLVIRHTDRWSPPILQVPGEGHLMYKPALINQGMMHKYGLRTTVLRVVMEMQNYALIELEMHASSRQQLQAVWVGRGEYARFRSTPEGEDDPLERWLDDRDKGSVPERRAPWLRQGWHKEAERWMSDKLIELGIQARGSVQQFKAGWPSSCLLRVSTLKGQVYFKATYDKPPGEAGLTRFLAEHWPDLAVKPLAVDEERGWMLSRDYEMKKNRPPKLRFPEFARALGRFQVEAMSHMRDWRDMACPVMDRGCLTNEGGWLENLVSRVKAQLAGGPAPLQPEDFDGLEDAIAAAGDATRALYEFDIPDTLSHLDFRPDNFFLEDGKCRLIDWADVAISHPFMAFCQTLDFFERYERGEPGTDRSKAIDGALKNEMTAAYLSAFEGLIDEDRAKKSFELAQDVFPLFWFLYLASQTCIIEEGTPQWGNINSLLKKEAKLLIAQHAGVP